MSVIQNLREKYATAVIIVVSISLVAFLLMDALVGPTSFLHNDTEVVTVNGVGFPYQNFLAEVQQEESNYQAQNPNVRMSEAVKSQIRQQVYNRFVQNQLLGEEYEDLGIGFSSAELQSLTISNDAAPEIKSNPSFQNPESGQFDPNRVVEFLHNLREAPANDQQAQQLRAQWKQLEDFLRNNAMVGKFSSLISQGLYTPTWLTEMKYADQNEVSHISFVNTMYSTVPDSSVTIKDSELQSYLDKHKKLYQVEAGRTVEYIAFTAIPSAKDSAEVFDRLKELSQELDTLPNEDVPGFISGSSQTSFSNRYQPIDAPSEQAEILKGLANGEMIGPYFDGSHVVYAKKLGSKTVADSVYVQQILISNQQVSDSVAKARVDSIEVAVKGGASFAAMVDQYSDAQKDNAGEIRFALSDESVPDEFAEFAEENSIGSLGIVETQFGYHLIRILNKKGSNEGYKIAYLSAELEASQKTDYAMFSEANKFRGLNQTREDFEKAANENGYQVEVANDLKNTDFSVNDLNSARELVQWAFKAKVNQLSDVMTLGNSYVIAVLTGKTEKGTATLASVRPQIESVVRRDKKAELIANRLSGNSLTDIAKAVDDSVKVANALSFSNSFSNELGGFEPKVVGAAFDQSWKDGKVSKPIFGNDGVFVLTIDSLVSQPADSSALAQMNNQLKNQLQQQVSNRLSSSLTEQAEIKDNRIKFY